MVESISTIASSKLGVDFKTHWHLDYLAATAKSARKHARSLAFSGECSQNTRD
jgi:Uri superfamily endonuclease